MARTAAHSSPGRPGHCRLRPHSTPARVPDLTTARIEPADRTLQVNGITLHYLDWGPEGLPPLILLHGISLHAHYWDGFAVRMRDAFHVYALDQRGHGDSDWAESYPPDSMPKDLLAFADALGLEKLTIVGHSMGGGVGMQFAAHHPERVERLVVVDAGLSLSAMPRPDNSVQRALAKDTFANEDELIEHFKGLLPGFDPATMMRQAMHSFRTQEDGSIVYKFDPALRKRMGSPEQMEQRRKTNAETMALLRKFTAPTLLIRGALSDILSPEGARETIAAFPNGTLVEIPDAGHNVPTDNRVAFRTAVREWMGLEA
ncbi:MAG: hypothetical protein C0506_04560 [Anaerolinea sp.]|nr:hypothetical protein [Anaerolinea sp.]